jgi:protein-L-isoaspartate(D-aspartate) O-methyltransferase
MDNYRAERNKMVFEQIESRGIHDLRVLAAMRQVPRHAFVDPALVHLAYADHPMQIGYGQTISQPYIVALFCELAEIHPDARVLDVGTGCGYQAAVLSQLAKEVFSIEIIEPLAVQAAQCLSTLHYDNTQIKNGDGTHGWPEYAPFDAILIAAATDAAPIILLEQLKVGGHLIVPIRQQHNQILCKITRTKTSFETKEIMLVSFVPFIHPDVT